MVRLQRLVLCGLMSACSGGSSNDAMVPVDIDNGTCGDMVRFTGEYLDWDSGTAFCGVFGAKFQVPGGVAGSTAPNGRFDLCLPDQPVTLLDITPPTAPSACSKTAGSYTIPGVAVASKSVILAGGFWSGRTFVMGRQAFTPDKAQVVVHIHGTPRAVTIGATHGATQVWDGSMWQSGSIGQDVFFPDVELGTGETTISAASAIAPDRIPLIAGTLTAVTIVLR